MQPIFFKNARIIDPSCNRDEVGALLVREAKIVDVGPHLLQQNVCENTKIINCDGKYIFPGFVDLRVFIDDFFSSKGETLSSISKAAVAGGVTTALVHSNNDFYFDDCKKISLFQTMKKDCLIHLYPAGSLSKKLKADELSEYGFMQQAGILALSEGKKTIPNSDFLYKSMLYAKNFDLLFFHETQEPALEKLGIVNDSLLANWLGLSTIIPQAEPISLARDLYLAKATNVRYHATQITTKDSLDLIKFFKDCYNLKFSASVSLHHLLFNDNDIGLYNPFYRFSPPLRSEEDRLSLIEAVSNGTIDCITSSHDPRKKGEKNLPFEMASPGSSSLETFFSGALRLYHNESLSLMRLIDLLSTKPAQILGLEAGTLKKGAFADILIADLNESWFFSSKNSLSRGYSNIFENTALQGRILESFVKGKSVFQAAKL